MKKILLNNLSLDESNMLSLDEKRKVFGGDNCGGGGWMECPNAPICVMDYSECPTNPGNPGGNHGNPGGNDNWPSCYEGGPPHPPWIPCDPY